MKKFYIYCLAAIAWLCCSVKSEAQSWPANYGGVMLQGFYWDSYKGAGYGTTKWADLTAAADELSQYFDLIWVPNCAKSTGGEGYMPIYWFSNFNSSYGNENTLKTMIETYKAKGVGLIEDCVINHRAGVSNWYNFPTETWNGKTYTMANGSICSTDECFNRDAAKANVPASYKGRPDEGEDFDGARDLDHTNATVQDQCKDYVKFLTTDRGFAGLRYDMVKGYSGYYTGMYNANANVKFSVGEYFDGSYDKVAAWINQTAEYGNGKGKSAAFDFPCKYQLNKALGGAGLACNELSWKANGVTDQPAGMIHYGYQQFAVTFVDNHDTFRDGSKFNSDYNVMAANAFILFSPGTPCIFWPHYYKNKTAMQALINARKAVGIHNMSSVNVIKVNGNVYIAEITGTKGKAIVKIGSENYTAPSGYTLKASGNNYAVWTTASGGIDTPIPSGDPFTVYFDNSSAKWATPYIHYWGGAESTWPGVAMEKVNDNVWKYTVPAGTTGILFNAGDGDATKTQDFTAQANHIYNQAGDQGVYNGGNGGGNGGGDLNTSFKVYFDNSTAQWATPYIHYWGAAESTWPGVAMSKETGDVWSYTVPAGTTGVLFNAGDGDATKTQDFTAQANHIYNQAGDQGVYNGGNGGGNGGGSTNPNTDFNVYFDNSVSNWETPYIHHWGSTETTWPGAAMSKHKDNVWKYTVPAGTTGILFNAGDGDATKTPDFTALADHLYTIAGDQGLYSGAEGGGNGGGNDTPTPNPGTYPETVYVIGNVNGYDWATDKGEAAKGNNGLYEWGHVTIDDAGAGFGYFAFVTVLGSSWDGDDGGIAVNSGDRYGAPAKDTPISLNQELPVAYYQAEVNASASESWMLAAGKYDLKLDLAKMKVTVLAEGAGIGDLEDQDAPVYYFNLQGVKVDNPQNGLYIRVQGKKAEKVIMK